MKKSQLYAMLFFFVNITASGVFAEVDYTADLYQLKSGRKEKLFKLLHEATPQENGIMLMKGVFSNLDGTPAFEESALVKDGELISMQVVQHQTGEKAKIEVKEGEVLFDYTNEKGEVQKTKKEKLRMPLVVPANFLSFIKKNWQKLLAGEKVDFFFAVWGRQQAVEFIFKLDKKQTIDGKEVVSLKMKPKSFIISALLDPIYFHVAADESKMVVYEGRVSPKIKHKKGWKDFDAEVVYN
jgi:hypothetical protein